MKHFLKSSTTWFETRARVNRWLYPAANRRGIHEMVRTIEQEMGTIDILVNNAGIGQVVPLALMEEEDWDKMMNVNVKGAFLTTPYFFPVDK